MMRRTPSQLWVHMLKNEAETKLVPASQWYRKGLRWHDHITQRVTHTWHAELGFRGQNPSLNFAQELFCALPSMDRAQDFPDSAKLDAFLNDIENKYSVATFSAQKKPLLHEVTHGADSRQIAIAVAKFEDFVGAVAVAETHVKELVGALSGVEHRLTKQALRDDSTHIRTPEKLVDSAALDLARLCGFSKSSKETDGSYPFEITTKGTHFLLGGWEVEAVPDIFVVRNSNSATDGLVIVFEDKSGQMAQGGMAQLLGEMLLCHYHNYCACDQRTAKPPSRVFAVRLYDVWASMYSLTASRRQVETMCKKAPSQWPTVQKLEFKSSVKEPWSSAKAKAGANLLHQPDRRMFVRLMAKLRCHLTQKL